MDSHEQGHPGHEQGHGAGDGDGTLSIAGAPHGQAQGSRGEPPLVGDGATAPPPGAADPLPQAMVLTAIVIGFSVLAFTLTLMHRVYQEGGSDDVDDLSEADVQ